MNKDYSSQEKDKKLEKLGSQIRKVADNVEQEYDYDLLRINIRAFVTEIKDHIDNCVARYLHYHEEILERECEHIVEGDCEHILKTMVYNYWFDSIGIVTRPIVYRMFVKEVTNYIMFESDIKRFHDL